MADEFFAAVHRAIDDPGSVTPRQEGESIAHWQARAVVDALGPDRAVYVLAIGHGLNATTAERVQRATMQALREGG